MLESQPSLPEVGGCAGEEGEEVDKLSLRSRPLGLTLPALLGLLLNQKHNCCVKGNLRV